MSDELTRVTVQRDRGLWCFRHYLELAERDPLTATVALAQRFAMLPEIRSEAVAIARAQNVSVEAAGKIVGLRHAPVCCYIGEHALHAVRLKVSGRA